MIEKRKENRSAGHSLSQSLKTYYNEMTSAQKCENINDPVDAHFFDALANVWTRLFIKLGVVPNAVTVMSMLCGVAGGVLIAFHTLPLTIIGVVLVIMSAIFDCSDGQVARRTRHFSKIGRLLDGFSDATGYFFITAATAICAARHCPRWVENPTWWTVGCGVAAFIVYLMYIRQCQLADYFKNVYMYMIDNSRGNELSRAKTIRAKRDAAPKGSFDRFAQANYAMYTATQEHRAPQTQKMLDKIEQRGKTDEIADAYHTRALRLVKLTNLMTFNLRTGVLILLLFLHLEVWLFAFVVVVLEPIRRILLWKFEKLARELQGEEYYKA